MGENARMAEPTDASATVASGAGVRTVAAVSFGGVLGSAARWGVGELIEVEPGSFPWATLVVNVVGCLLIGVAATRVDRGGVAWAGLVTGGLGGFTTMSAFAQELNDLADADRTAMVTVYLAVTLVAGLGALVAGERAAR